MLFACISILVLSSCVKGTLILSVTQRTSPPLSVLRLYLLKLTPCELRLCACLTTVQCRPTFYIEIYFFLRLHPPLFGTVPRTIYNEIFQSCLLLTLPRHRHSFFPVILVHAFILSEYLYIYSRLGAY